MSKPQAKGRNNGKRNETNKQKNSKKARIFFVFVCAYARPLLPFFGQAFEDEVRRRKRAFISKEAYMLNPNAKTFNPPTPGASGAASSSAAQMSSHYNAVSTKERNTNTSVQDLTASLGDFGFVDEDDTDDLSALIHADGGEGGLDDGVDGGGGGVPYTGYNNFQHAEVDEQIDEEKMRWLVQEFPNIDETILEDILFNAAHGDINGALDLLEELEKDYEVPLPEAPAINEENFPSLGGDGGGKAGDNNNIHKNNIATKKEEEELPRKMYLSGGRSNYVERQAPATSLSTTSSLIQPSLTVTRPTYFDSSSQNRATAAKPEWVQTGESVSNLYEENRAEARDLARVRNVCYEQATTAFLSGNKALAKELSAKGKEAAKAMKQAHEQASNQIYSERNNRNTNTIDLHGLHVAEALQILKRELGTGGGKLSGEISILVGTGHHTKGSRTPSRLPRSVEEWLISQNIHFTEPVSGEFLVRVS
jgi:DNA-nicking Smr family endonuclease